MSNRLNKKGFTIIEVVLVLAIAGLIFLMVFIALPALQRSQRDTQRSNDISRFMTAVTQYQANNNGKIPTNNNGWVNFVNQYLKANNDTFIDPDGTEYEVKPKGTFSGTSAAPNENYRHQIWIYTQATCDGENPSAATGERQIAILYKREGAGVICRNN